MVDCKTLIFLTIETVLVQLLLKKKKRNVCVCNADTHSRPQMTGFWFHMAQMRKQTGILGLDEIRENIC